MTDSSNRFIRYLRRLGAGSLLVSVILHVVILILATVWVISNVQEERKASFQGGSGAASPGPVNQEHRVQMSRQQQNLSAVNQRLAVDSPNAAVSLPDLPAMPGFSAGGPALSGNLGGSGGGIGSGAGLGKGPVMPAFGFREAGNTAALTGYLYDLKQTREEKPNPTFQKMLATMRGIAPYDELLVKEVGSFIQSNWNPRILQDKFYRWPNPLYATQVFVPDTPAAEA